MSNSPPAYLFVVRQVDRPTDGRPLQSMAQRLASKENPQSHVKLKLELPLMLISRHGSRLDAADKSWHLTSPTPYDPPLTYGGFLQARQVGNHIASILERAKADDETSAGLEPSRHRKPRRYKVVIHSSPFLRCVQTSIGISSGLAQTFAHSNYNPRDHIVPRAPPQAEPQFQFKSTLLRLDSFLGEWLSPEYFENITPPPGPALMLGGAKAELLRREDYGIYADIREPEPPRPSSGSLWQSPLTSPANVPSSPSTESDASINVSTLRPALPGGADGKKGYTAPRPIHAVSSSGSIPEGFVAHARDSTVIVDYQWDSMRSPLDFGDSGQLGEEWASMHKRFRNGLTRLVNWYASTDSSADHIAKAVLYGHDGHDTYDTHDTHDTHPTNATHDTSQDSANDLEDIETVVIMVSHGAGCNALIGAVTHRPVLMDIGIASITMASRKRNLDYGALLSSASTSSDSCTRAMVPVDKMYDLRLSASTEHLRRPSTATTPNSARSISAAGVWNTNAGSRGRTSTMGGPVMSPFMYSDPFSSTGSRSTSASPAFPSAMRQESAPQYAPLPRVPALASVGFGSGSGGPLSPGNRSPTTTTGLWSAGPSNLRLMDDGSDDTSSLGSLLPDFDQKKFSMTEETPATDKASSGVRAVTSAEPVVSASVPVASTTTTTTTAITRATTKTITITATNTVTAAATRPPTDDAPRFPDYAPLSSAMDIDQDSPRTSTPPVFTGPMKLCTTNLDGSDKPPVEELKVTQLGGGLGGLWGIPPPVGEADRFRDKIHTKRRWTAGPE
ncbi:hypothetical protein E4U24_003068 [Claviceps purpurea]|nr:hypothetical protein E4U37_007686 [Claviceps purpurea]KAG6258168.1 hypothetical protein E4U24_003068 [Claviceps purpurea]